MSGTLFALGEKAQESNVTIDQDDPATTVKVRPRPARPRLNRMPPWKVLLHNDNVHEMGYVVEAIIELTTLDPRTALIRMLEAHKVGTSLLLMTHREHAELMLEQFTSKGLTVTIEPDA